MRTHFQMITGQVSLKVFVPVPYRSQPCTTQSPDRLIEANKSSTSWITLRQIRVFELGAPEPHDRGHASRPHPAQAKVWVLPGRGFVNGAYGVSEGRRELTKAQRGPPNAPREGCGCRELSGSDRFGVCIGIYHAHRSAKSLSHHGDGQREV